MVERGGPEWARVVYSTPATADVIARKDLVYKTRDGVPALADLYRPAGAPAGTALPAVIFVHGDAPPERGDAKEWGQYLDWGALTAASGMVAVTFNHRSSEHLTRLPDAGGDVDDLLAWVRADGAGLGIDTARLGLWCCSAGVPYGMRTALTGGPPPLRCVVAYYGFLDLRGLAGVLDPPVGAETLAAFSALALVERSPRALPPTLVAKAALDGEEINRSIDRFVAASRALAAPVEYHVTHCARSSASL